MMLLEQHLGVEDVEEWPTCKYTTWIAQRLPVTFENRIFHFTFVISLNKEIVFQTWTER
jgi:hypothetical protein